MYTLYGIWIDHAHATVVQANKLGDMELTHVSSDVEAHNHGGESEEHLTVVNQHRHEERRHNQMKAFCQEILSHVKNADELVIFGPGTAKFDLKHEVENHKDLSSKLKDVETTDALTDAELKDYVKKTLMLPRP